MKWPLVPGSKKTKSQPSSKRGKVKKNREKDKSWSFVKDCIDIGLELRRPYERQWMINLAFLAGRQYMFFNQSAHLLQQLNRVKGRVRNVDNQLGWRWGRMVADMIKTAPSMSVVPQSNSSDDIKAAKLGDKVLKAWWLNNKMKHKVRQISSWIYATGNCFLDDRWDKRAGPTSFDEDGSLVYDGDVDCGVWSPLEIGVPFTGLGQVDVHKFPWLWKMKYVQLDRLAAMYKRGGEVTGESMPYQFADMMGMIGSGIGSTQIPGAFQVNLYVQPNKQFPRGRFFTAANGIILDEQDWPLNHYHIEQFKDIDIPGMFWGKAKMDSAIPLQKSWNRNCSSIEEYNRKMGLGKGLVPKGAKLEHAPDDTHGEWIYYNPVLGHKPEFMQHKGLPQTYQWEQERIQASFDNLFHQHHASRGMNRSDLRSEDMLAFLREQDATGGIPTYVIFEEAMEAVASRVLKRIQQGYTNERMLNIRGDDGDIEVFSFKGADLRNNTDVLVKSESSLPDSRQARESIILKKFEMGWYGNPQDPKVQRIAQRLMEDAVHKDIHSELALDESLARWENGLFNDPNIDQVTVNVYDNHQVHLEEHSKARKDMEYQKMKVTNPKVFAEQEMKRMVHIQEHQELFEEQQKAMLAKQMQIQETIKGGGKSGGQKGASNK